MAETASQTDLSQYVNAPLLDRPIKPLEGNSAFITGATRFPGIGFAIAELFASEGASPIIVAGTENSIVEAAAVRERLMRYGILAYTLVGDVGLEESCVEMMAKGYELCQGNVNILVNNAGANEDKLFTDVTEEDLEFALRVKAKGAAFMSREWFRIRDDASIRGGKIINISSIVGLHGNFGQEAYAMANGALNALTKTLALDFGRRGITVNAIAPAFVPGTNLAGNITPEQMDLNMTLTPLKDARTRRGVVLTTRDIAGAAFYLAGPDGDHVTGQILVIDGGFGTNHTGGAGLRSERYRKIPQAALNIVESLTKEDVEAIQADRKRRAEGVENG